VVAVTRRSWRPLAAPAAFLLAATIAILVARAVLDHHRATTPAPAARAAVTTTRSKAAPKPHHRLYTVRAGDTLAAIAAHTHVPLARIEALNPSLQPTALFIGEKIRLS
jgi:Tfp pilus assembly protein FimV